MVKLNTTEAVLDYYAMLRGPFIVQFSNDPPTKWLLYPSDEYTKAHGDKAPRHRLVFVDEVIIELDIEDKKLNNTYAIQICNTLKKNNITYSRWSSGGKSNHIHINFGELNKYHSDVRPLMKWILIKHYCEGLIGKAKVDKGLTKNRHMIRTEWSEREDGKGKKRLLEQYKAEAGNTIPSACLLQFDKDLEDENKRRKLLAEMYKNNPTLGTTEDTCIRFIKSDDTPLLDGRKNSLFILACHYAISMPYAETYSKLMEWNVINLKGYFNDYQITQVLKSVYKNGYKPGVRFKREFLDMVGRPDLVKALDEEYNITIK